MFWSQLKKGEKGLRHVVVPALKQLARASRAAWTTCDAPLVASAWMAPEEEEMLPVVASPDDEQDTFSSPSSTEVVELNMARLAEKAAKLWRGRSVTSGSSRGLPLPDETSHRAAKRSARAGSAVVVIARFLCAQWGPWRRAEAAPSDGSILPCLF